MSKGGLILCVLVVGAVVSTVLSIRTLNRGDQNQRGNQNQDADQDQHGNKPEPRASARAESHTRKAVPPARPPAETGAVATSLQFDNGTEATGLHFQHHASRTPQRYMPETMGAGLAIADFNRDGAPDVVFIDSGSFLPGDKTEPVGRSRLYINDGTGHFRDRTDAWHLPSIVYGMGVATGDFDNDGWCDLFLTAYGRDRLLRNTGTRFVDVTDRAGIEPDGAWSTSAGFFDLEPDGDLDLYVVRYVNYSLDDALKCYSGGYHVYCTPILFDAAPDRLLRNNGDGTFTDVSREAGLHAEPCKGLALAIGDVEFDGDQDIFVANDTSRNFLLINDAAGHLADRAPWLGVAYSEVGAEEAGMGADLADFDGDGLMDIVCTNFQGETTSLYQQRKGGFFLERSDAVGLGSAARRRLSFGVDFFDADNDGDEDLLVANGHIEDNVHNYRSDVTFAQRDTLYENLGNGAFRDVTPTAGAAFKAVQVSRGLATGDLDGDGDIDFIVTENDGPALVGLNATEPKGHFVGLWLEGRHANRSAIGARVVARVGERILVRQVLGASSYLSSCDRRIHIGLAQASSIDELTVHWPGGGRDTVRDLPGGAYYRWVEGRSPVRFLPGERTIDP